MKNKLISLEVLYQFLINLNLPDFNKGKIRIFTLALFVSSLMISNEAQCQQTLIQITQWNWNTYVHLPADYYSNPGKAYPTIIFFPGITEVGTDASLVIENGPGAYIAQGWDGNVSTGTGDSVEFIVISVQPVQAWPNNIQTQSAIQTLKGLYRIDPSKLYLAGLSMGAWQCSQFVTGDSYGGPYPYASQVAAEVDVEGVAINDKAPDLILWDNFAKSGGRLACFEQLNDFRDMQAYVNQMDSIKPASAIYTQTDFGDGSHCCWSSFYGGEGVTPGNFILDGVSHNIYQWLANQSLALQNNGAPTITSGTTASGTTGTAFSYTITASNTPISYAATSLPAGLSINTATGVISGTPTTTGTFNVTISAINAKGTGTSTVSITIAGIITVYFENTSNWAQPNVYSWSPMPSTYTTSPWPGNNMTKVSNCGNWWSYTFTGVDTINLIFNNGGTGSSNQTVNLSLSSPGIYNYSWLTQAWNKGAPSCNTPPVVSISPSSTSFTDSIQVTLTVTDDKPGSVIYYTTNGSTAITSSTIYTVPLWVKATTTINATAQDVDGAMATTPVSATYTKVSSIVVYFENTTGWQQPKVYCWSPTPSTYGNCSSWPGNNMTKVANCGNWWSYTFTGVTATNLIFNDGATNQTADLSLSAPGIYNYSWATKVWVNGAPACTTLPTSINVYFENNANWSQPKVYCWSPTPSTYGGCSSWPGNNMSKIASCGNWWIYTFTGVNATNLIFNDGGSNQTANLYLGSAGTYNYSWSSNAWANGSPVCSSARPSFIESGNVGNEITANVSPNPIVNNNLQLSILNARSGNATIKIVDLEGRLIKQLNNITITSGNNNLSLNIGKVATGYYVAFIQMDGYTTPIKFMVN